MTPSASLAPEKPRETRQPDKFVTVGGREVPVYFVEDENREAEEIPELPESFWADAKPNPFAQKFAPKKNLRLLAPDLAAAFPDDQAVDRALRTLQTIARETAVFSHSEVVENSQGEAINTENAAESVATK